MTGNFCRLVNTVSRLLEPDERDAVLGDFAESGETGGQALCGLCGLILRRQTKLWKCWRPWLVLLSLVIPLAWLLSVAARLTASSSAVYLWSYLNNWDWTLLRYGSFWSILRDAAVAVSVQYTLLACWSWSAGLLLGSASRRTAPGNFLFFCVISLFGEVLAASRYLASWFVRPWSAQSDPVSALPVYKEILPVLVLIVLVVIPLAWAMRDAADLKWFHTPFRISLLFIAGLATVGMILQQPGLGFSLDAHSQLAFLRGWPRKVLHFVVYWPVAYLLLRATSRLGTSGFTQFRRKKERYV